MSMMRPLTAVIGAVVGLALSASATFAGSYQDAYLVQGASPAQYNLNKTLGRTGDGIPNVPRFQANFGLNYRRPIMNGWDGVAATDVSFRGRENSYFSSAVLHVGPPLVYENVPLSPYSLVNLRLGVIKDLWSVTAFARNLTDKRAQVSAINSSQDPDALLTVRPRTIGLTATRKF